MKLINVIKRGINFFVISIFLMAFQCEDENEDFLKYDAYKVSITPSSSFSVDDTVWVKAIVSSKVYDLSINDSVFNEYPQSDYFSVYKLVEPDEASNCKGAVDKFELIFDKGEFSFFSCENADLVAMPALEFNDSFYVYRVGLRPLYVGDYVISWRNAIIQNADRNEFIINDYPIADFPNQIGFNSCGEITWRVLNESEREYYFRVE
ncbi:hypothetical protein J1N10_05180 [Carboxylicivirga sp. A043]|uniref:hypothetical protein n=1 Tax=Carboxylicivirga litoralis TaxID=2816963 RepID=UPI0021CB8BF9|nr:hypothetical protein [Carboxylicivirga sp. A043]MCU4155357.1 hypothetical protein [Carboxylicivirga sp. A043]